MQCIIIQPIFIIMRRKITICRLPDKIVKVFFYLCTEDKMDKTDKADKTVYRVV